MRSTSAFVKHWRRSSAVAGQIDAVRGYADTRLCTRNTPLDARNRRISIVVQNGAGI